MLYASTHDVNFYNKNHHGTKYIKYERIRSIDICQLTSQEILDSSVCCIDIPTLYKKSLPRNNSLNDVRLGPVDNTILCGTCHNNYIDCNGHFGHIVLPIPLFNTLYISSLLKVLRCICSHCFQAIGSPRNSLEDTYNALKTKKHCVHCKHVQPKYCQQIFHITSPDFKQFTAQTALDILLQVPPNVWTQMGLKMHPKHFILTHLIVPPCAIRPCIQFSDSCRARAQDDLTLKLQEIVKQCQRLHKNDQLSEAQIYKLQVEVATYFNNEGNNQLHAPKKHSGLQEKCIIKRFKGKYGRIRGNLQGKRVDYSARTVITPGCHIDIDEVGVPAMIASKLTLSVKVTQLNHAWLMKLMRQNKIVSYVNHKQQKHLIKYCKTWPNVRLQLGWSVQRQLMDGDYVLLNRQPSLRKKSIMGHRVKIWPGKTIQLNLSCTSAYNADFDGDEMNIHCPQDIESQVEIRELMAVDKQIMNAQNNKPIVTIIQDTLLGCFIMTDDAIQISRDEWMNCVMCIKYPPKDISILPTTQIYTGKQLFSMVLPNVSINTPTFAIKNGEFTEI